MPAVIPSQTLERLVALGRSRGHLTTDDLARALPVDTMAADEIALVVVHLEEAGVPVELDDALLTGGPRTAMPNAATPEFALPDEPPQAPRAPHHADTTSPSLAATEAAPSPAAGRSAHGAVLIAGVLVTALLALLIWGLAA